MRGRCRTPLSVAAGVLILTLCDGTTPLHLAGAYDCAAVRDWITFHCGAPLDAAEDAMFALGDWAALQPLDQFTIRVPDYPDRSATLIVEMAERPPQVPRCAGRGSQRWRICRCRKSRHFRPIARCFRWGLTAFSPAMVALPPCRDQPVWRLSDVCCSQRW